MLRHAVFRLVFALCLVVWIGSCAVRWSPAYDRPFYDKLIDLNDRTLTLFSSVSAGASANTFKDHQAGYDEAIGGFEALRLVALARPTPRIGWSGAQAIAEKACGPGVPIEECVYATPASLSEIVEDLSKMRNLHKSGRLQSDVVRLLKQDYEVSVQQVLVLEAALKR